MAKAHRGAGIRELHSNGRGTCPACNRTAIKVMYEQELEGNKVKVCKQCHAKTQNAK